MYGDCQWVEHLILRAWDAADQHIKQRTNAFADSLERWLARAWPKLTQNKWERHLHYFLDAWARDSIAIDETSRTALIAWLYQCSDALAGRPAGTSGSPPAIMYPGAGTFLGVHPGVFAKAAAPAAAPPGAPSGTAPPGVTVTPPPPPPTATASPGTVSPPKPGTTVTRPPAPATPPAKAPAAGAWRSAAAAAFGRAAQGLAGNIAMAQLQRGMSPQDTVAAIFVYELHPRVQRGEMSQDIALAIFDRGLKAANAPGFKLTGKAMAETHAQVLKLLARCEQEVMEDGIVVFASSALKPSVESGKITKDDATRIIHEIILDFRSGKLELSRVTKKLRAQLDEEVAKALQKLEDEKAAAGKATTKPEAAPTPQPVAAGAASHADKGESRGPKSVHRVYESGQPKFQLRHDEEGVSVFDAERVRLDQILSHFRPGSLVTTKQRVQIESLGLKLVKTPGDPSLPALLKDNHWEIQPGDGMVQRPGQPTVRNQFKRALKALSNS